MSLPQWVTFLAVASAAIAYVFWVYRRRELAVGSRTLYASLRAGAVVVALLLLFDPVLSVGATGSFASTRWVLIDRSQSMEARTGPNGPSRWEGALERARELQDQGWTVVAFGSETSPFDPANAPGLPTDAESVLGTALRRAVESGVSEVVVLTDRRILDPLAVHDAVARFALDVSFESPPESLPNVGIEDVIVPTRIQSADPFEVVVRFRAEGLAAADSITVEILREGVRVAGGRTTVPLSGRRAEFTVEVPAPEQSGHRVYEASVSAVGDGFVRDDLFAFDVPVDGEENGLVFLSLSPDWEPRFLLPVLEQVTGLPTQGYLVGSDDRLWAMGSDDGPLPVDSLATLRSAAAEAELLVVHGLVSSVPEWVVEAVRSAPRVVLIPVGPVTESGLSSLPTASSIPGEWYAQADLPSSPLSGDLVGVRLDGLPPVTGLLGTTLPEGAIVPVQVGTVSGGRSEPAVYLHEVDDARHAVVLSQGLWRWAFRPGDARDAYVRLWSGMSGWLLAGGRAASTTRVRPVEHVVAERAPVAFRSTLPDAETRLRVTGGPGIEIDTTLVSDGSALLALPALPPGRYRFEGSVGDEAPASGEFVVSPYSADRLVPPMDPVFPEAEAGAEANDRARIDTGRPLRTHPLPYLLILILLSLEWIGRRRHGLR